MAKIWSQKVISEHTHLWCLWEMEWSMGSTQGSRGGSRVPGCMCVSVSNRKGSVPAPTWLLRERELSLNYKLRGWTAGTWKVGGNHFPWNSASSSSSTNPVHHIPTWAGRSSLLAMTVSVPCYSALWFLLGVRSQHVLTKAPRDTTEMKAQCKSHFLTYVVTMHVSRSVIYMYLLTYISGMGWLESLTVPAFWDF